MSQARGEVCGGVWRGLAEAKSRVGDCQPGGWRGPLLGWNYQLRVGVLGFSGSSLAMGHQAGDKHSFLGPHRKLSPRDRPPAHLLRALETGTEKKPPGLQSSKALGPEPCAPPDLATHANLTISGWAESENCPFSRRSCFMTSRQSGWHRPGDARRLYSWLRTTCVAGGRSFPLRGEESPILEVGGPSAVWLLA